MKSIKNLANQPAALPIVADDILEFHAARLLLLFSICGTAGRIDGLTKMAKLDFFVRYPQFFSVVNPSRSDKPNGVRSVESSMVRFHYGPWDKRYYHILAYLEAKGLLNITRKGKQFQLELTLTGKEIAKSFTALEGFQNMILHMKQVKKVLGTKSGNSLKNLIYTLFDNEITKKPLGETIS